MNHSNPGPAHGLPRRTEALRHAHHGDLALRYRHGDDLLRAEWVRGGA